MSVIPPILYPSQIEFLMYIVYIGFLLIYYQMWNIIFSDTTFGKGFKV
jgi:hypothetical protein